MNCWRSSSTAGGEPKCGDTAKVSIAEPSAALLTDAGVHPQRVQCEHTGGLGQQTPTIRRDHRDVENVRAATLTGHLDDAPPSAASERWCGQRIGVR